MRVAIRLCRGKVMVKSGQLKEAGGLKDRRGMSRDGWAGTRRQR